MQNEHIEHFKRWQKAYLMWAYSNFDRIVAETAAKYKKEMLEERKRNNPSELDKFVKMLFAHNEQHMNRLVKQLTEDVEFYKGSQWNNAQIGSTLKIRTSGTGTISSSPR